jgi:hypothetical protein
MNINLTSTTFGLLLPVERHVRADDWKFDPAKVSLFHKNETRGRRLLDDMEERKKALAGRTLFNFCMLEWYLGHTDQIPPAWEKGVYFWDTVFNDNGDRQIAYLHKKDGKWKFGYQWLGLANSIYPAVAYRR